VFAFGQFSNFFNRVHFYRRIILQITGSITKIFSNVNNKLSEDVHFSASSFSNLHLKKKIVIRPILLNDKKISCKKSACSKTD
jgi:hypothetical protein